MKQKQTMKLMVAFFAAVVINFVLAGCDPTKMDESKTTSLTGVAKPVKTDTVPPVDTLSWKFAYGTQNHTTSVDVNWSLDEYTKKVSVTGSTHAWVSHERDRYAIPDNLRNIYANYCQEHTSQSQVYTRLISSTLTEKVWRDSVVWTSETEDGNLLYCHATWERKQIEVDNKTYSAPYIKVVDAKVVNINNLPGNTMTRATYVSDSLVREATWELSYEVVRGDVPAYAFGAQSMIGKQNLVDMYKVLLLSEDEIERGYFKNKERKPLDDLTERCSFDLIYVMKSGEEHTSPKNRILNRWIHNIPEWLETVTSFSFTHKNVSPIEYGAIQYGIRKEDGWTDDARTFTRHSTASNGNEIINLVYNGYSEGTTYEDKWVKVEFPILDYTITEAGTHVEGIISDNDGYEQARLFNTINTTYLGWNQGVNETVKLQMKKAEPEDPEEPEIYIINEDWDYLKTKYIIYNDSIVWLPVYVIEYSDGNRVETPFHFIGERGLENYGTFDVIEDNESEKTGDVNMVLANSREVKAEDKGAKATWTRSSYNLSNGVQLNASRQENHWRSVESDGMTVVYRNKSFTFPKNNIYTSHKSSVTGGNVVDQYKVYNYTDMLSYTFGDNTQTSAAKGIIRVPAVTVVFEGWDESSAREIWSNNRVDWTLDWVTKFSNGTEDRISFSCDDSRLYTVDTNWNSEENDATYSTGNYVVNVTKSENQSKSVKGANFAWVRETRSIYADVTLAGSIQRNGWTARDPFACSVTYKGKTYDFGRRSLALSHVDSRDNGHEVDGYTVYNYGDAMSYTVADNTKTLTAPGVIRVKIDEPEVPTFFPKEWGEVIAVYQTNSNTESHEGSVTILSFHFKNHIVLPVVDRLGSSVPEWHFEYAEFTLVDDYNSASYEASSDTWVNTIAKDQTNHMVWSREGGERGNKDYNEAKDEGKKWDLQHWPNGRPSTKTSRFNYSITDGAVSLTDTYSNTYVGTYTSYTGK